MSDAPSDAGYRQHLFIKYHHHLISPWLYDRKTIIDRNNAMLSARWPKIVAVEPVGSVVEPTETLAVEWWAKDLPAEQQEQEKL